MPPEQSVFYGYIQCKTILWLEDFYGLFGVLSFDFQESYQNIHILRGKKLAFETGPVSGFRYEIGN